MDFSYFHKINNAYLSKSKQETELYLVNRNEDMYLYDNIDYAQVLRNGEPFEMIIIKDTDGNTYKKKIKSKHDTPFNLGDYIEWNNQIWLVTLLDTNDKVHHSGYMYLCTAKLHWQNSGGTIIERPVYVEDFTKYSTGTYSNNAITIGENQYGLHIPIDEETKKLRRDMRFVIDFDDVERPDVYKLSNRKMALNNDTYFGRGGTMILTLSYDVFNSNNDRLVDFKGKKVWICDYKNYYSGVIPPETTENLSGNIIGADSIKINLPRSYHVVFTDENGNEVSDCNFQWNIIGSSNIKKKIEKNTIELFVDNDSLAGESFLLQVLVNEKLITEKSILIRGAF